MKTLIFSVFLFLTFSSWSQINSGGGPDGDGGPKDIPLNEILILHSQYNELLNLSNRQWKICFKDSSIRFGSLQEVYLQLIWKDLKSSVANNNCNLSNEKKEKDIPCFFQDENFRYKLKVFFNSKHIGSFLNFVEDQESTNKEFINYFKYKSTEKE